MMMTQSFVTDVCGGIMRVSHSSSQIYGLGSLSDLISIVAMLRGDSIFIDGGVEVLRANGTTWLGFSKPTLR